MAESHDLPDLVSFAVGTEGPAGQRVFYLQAVAPGEVVTLRLEKQQVALLADYLARVVGEKHLKMTVRQGGSVPFDSIGFGMKSLEEQGLSVNTPIDVAFTPELNHWNGYDRIQLRIRDIRASGVD